MLYSTLYCTCIVFDNFSSPSLLGKLLLSFIFNPYYAMHSFTANTTIPRYSRERPSWNGTANITCWCYIVCTNKIGRLYKSASCSPSHIGIIPTGRSLGRSVLICPTPLYGYLVSNHQVSARQNRQALSRMRSIARTMLAWQSQPYPIIILTVL